MAEGVRPYPRDTSQRLCVVDPIGSHGYMTEVRCAIWSGYLGEIQSSLTPQPIATRWIQLIASGSASVAEFRPGSYYPAGFRSQVLSGCGFKVEPIDAADSPLGHWLRNRVQAPHRYTHEELANAAEILNLLTCYDRTIRAFYHHVEGVNSSPIWPHVIRARYMTHMGLESASLLSKVAEADEETCASRLRAAIGLISHYNRRDFDEKASSYWCQEAGRLLVEIECDEFERVNFESHYRRALALHYWRRADVRGSLAELSAARECAVELGKLANSVVRELVAAQSERLVLEATLKTVPANPHIDRLEVAQTAARLWILDPNDPYAAMAAGDACWIAGCAAQAISYYQSAALCGTLLGAVAAYKASRIIASEGEEVAEEIAEVARTLDPAAP